MNKSGTSRTRTGHETFRLSNITNERSRTDVSDLAKRNTNFRQHFNDPLTIPANIVHPGRPKQDNRFHLDVGPIKDD